MGGRTTTTAASRAWTPWHAVLAIILLCCALSLAGCKSGSLGGLEQSCRSTGGFLAGKTVTCTGGVDVVKGEPSLGVIDTDGDLSGDYELEATISVKRGQTKAYVDTSDGGREGGTVSPGKPLRVGAVVALDEEDDEVSVDLKVLDKEARGLRYEARALPRK